jgi:hypothetical protein
MTHNDYLDARTPEERAYDAKNALNQITTTASTHHPQGEKKERIYANGPEFKPVAKLDFTEPHLHEGWEERLEHVVPEKINPVLEQALKSFIQSELERAEETARLKLIGERSDSLGLFTVAHGKKESDDYVRGAAHQKIADQVKVDEIARKAREEERAQIHSAFNRFVESFIEIGDNSIDVESLEYWRGTTLTPEKHTNPSESV